MPAPRLVRVTCRAPSCAFHMPFRQNTCQGNLVTLVKRVVLEGVPLAGGVRAKPVHEFHVKGLLDRPNRCEQHGYGDIPLKHELHQSLSSRFA